MGLPAESAAREGTARVRRLMSILVTVLAVEGCASAPPGPRGPLMGPGIEVATDWSYAYGPGEATVADGSTSKGGADYYWSSFAIFPRRLEARLSPIKWVDIGGQIGWLGGGADIRVGLPALEGTPVAFNLAAGFETGEAGFFKETKPLRSRWLRLEAYPLVPLPGRKNRLVLAAGVNFGQFHHELPDPRPQVGFSDAWGPSDVQTIRSETRVETSIGLFLPARFASALITVSPYYVIDAGTPRMDCDACTIAVYKQSWGVVLVSRFALRLGF
jgi:hypothetical protein